MRKEARRMSIESAIERMNRDTRDYLKDLLSVFKKTRDPNIAVEIITVLKNHGESCSEKELKLYLGL